MTRKIYLVLQVLWFCAMSFIFGYLAMEIIRIKQLL